MAETFGLPPDEFASRIDRRALTRALEAPAAAHRGKLIHRTLTEQAAALTLQMLRSPPLPAARRVAAYLTLQLFVDHSGWHLEVTQPIRDAFMLETESVTPTRERLVEWIGARLQPGSGRASVQTGTRAAPTPLVYVGVQVCSVCSDESKCEHERDLAEAIRGAVRVIAQERGWPDVRVEVPGLPYLGEAIREDMNLDDFNQAVRQFTEASPNDRLRHSMLTTLRNADALIILGGESPSFGNGNEFGRAANSTARLYLHLRDRPQSRWLDDDPSSWFLRFRNHDGLSDEVAADVEAWMRDHALLIEASWRRRQRRLEEFGPIAALFAGTWGSLHTGRERLEAFVATGLPVGVFHELLSPDGVAGASLEDLVAMARALGLSIESLLDQDGPRVFALSAMQRNWLIEFADRTQITRRQEHALQDEAERQLALGVLRYGLTSIEDWYAFAREVARERLA